MPKRRNPFGEGSPLQLKQHVGLKEIDLGVAQEHKMKEVYEKTKELLFSGSKRSLDIVKDANCNDIYTTSIAENTDVMMEEESGQMKLTSSGQLTRPDAYQPKNAFEALMMSRKANTASSCQCCKGQAASQDRCGFCERAICFDCVRSCVSCDGHFCQLCSVMNYDDITERSFCLQCAS